MDGYRHTGKSRITKGNRVVADSDLESLPEGQLKTFCKKKIIEKLKQKKDDS